MRRLMLAVLMVVSLIGGGATAQGAEFTAEQAVLMKLFGSDPITPEMFTAGFLAQVSIEQVLAVFAKTRATVGPPVSIEQSGSSYIVHTATHQVPVDIGLDASGRIAGLLIHPAAENFASIDQLFAAITSAARDVSYLVTRDGEVLYAAGQTRPLAVGSAFKLGVLAALADEIAAGRLGWDRVVKLGAGDISLPSGTLQTMPVGSPMTVHTLAAFMIAQSDNTATDVLMDLVGRDKVNARLGLDFTLKTTEFFKLKSDPALRLRYLAADAAGRARTADDMAAMPLPAATEVEAPLDDGIEWYLSASKLCSLIAETADLDVFTINPGVARKADWAHVAFKGGSEVGVANLTSALTDKAGAKYCVAVTWNDGKAFDEGRLTSLYGSLVAKLAGR